MVKKASQRQAALRVERKKKGFKNKQKNVVKELLEDSKGESFFERLNSSSVLQQEKSLLALAAISFDENMPLDQFYSQGKSPTSSQSFLNTPFRSN